MRRSLARVALFALVPALSSCDLLPGGACTAEARAGINLVVSDSVTGAPAAAGAIGVARDGTYADTLVSLDGHTMAGAWERPGIYTVSVSKTGYVAWTLGGVRVSDGGCHVQGVMLEARLKPE
jgi:hypothetical protein